MCPSVERLIVREKIKLLQSGSDFDCRRWFLTRNSQIKLDGGKKWMKNNIHIDNEYEEMGEQNKKKNKTYPNKSERK
ncbi:hypothetical protein NQ317_000102 [Molorchus minor]|uniref:Uncharacterized protein n=1 Tax=Molorchus minor TaxID=1323400 RepID=A0ABQ9IZD4_9CUCU|nr:hypothetical protein NQ317_000102 [Molorchus minor]